MRPSLQAHPLRVHNKLGYPSRALRLAPNPSDSSPLQRRAGIAPVAADAQIIKPSRSGHELLRYVPGVVDEAKELRSAILLRHCESKFELAPSSLLPQKHRGLA